VLGEELGHRTEVCSADLALRVVDLFLLVLLPELVHPSEGVVSCEDLCREVGDDGFEGEPTFGSEAQTNTRVVEPEDAGKDLGGEAGRDRPAVGFSERPREFIAVLESNRSVVLGMNEEVVLSKEAGEEQSVPVLVGAFGYEQVEVVPLVTELSRLGSQAATKLAVLLVEMRWGTLRCHGQGGEAGSHCLLGGAPALVTGVLENLPLLRGEYRHGFVP
jgi:hypothetical protein